MKIRLGGPEELYPHHSIALALDVTEDLDVVHVEEATGRRWLQAYEDFEAVRGEIAKAYELVDGRHRKAGLLNRAEELRREAEALECEVISLGDAGACL
jgi:hypothetical protein